MWPKIFRRNSAGPDQIDRLINELADQNALLRAQLAQQGVAVPKLVPSLTKKPPRRATAADVTVLTRDDQLAQQIQAEMSPDERKAREVPSSSSLIP